MSILARVRTCPPRRCRRRLARKTRASICRRLTEGELARHYAALAQQALRRKRRVLSPGLLHHEIQPQRIDEDVAALPGFTGVHPLQSGTHVAAAACEVLRQAEELL